MMTNRIPLPLKLWFALCAAVAIVLIIAARSQAGVGEICQLRVVECNGYRCTFGYGTSWNAGHLNTNRWLYVTAAHNVRGRITNIHVGINGAWVPAQVLGTDHTRDIALLGVKYDGDLDCLILSEGSVQPGSSVTLAGFPLGGNGRRVGGTWLSEMTARMQDGAPKRGDSGGPVYNEQKQVVGMCSGYDDQRMLVMSSAEQIRSTIVETLGGLPSCQVSRPDVPVPPPERNGGRASEPFDYDLLADKLLERMASDGRFRGPPGKKGDKGDKGDRGSPGRDGDDAEIDYPRLRDMIIEKIAGDPRFRGKDGEPGTVVVRIVEDGEELYKTKPLRPGTNVTVPVKRTRTESEGTE